jgi:diamine N-acetyltransferase
MELAFKTAKEQDIPIISALADKIWRIHYPTLITIEQIEYMLGKMYSAESLKEQMNEGHMFSLVYVNNAPAGYISVSTKDDKNYFLHKFYVQVEEHGKGIGSQLFQHILNQLKHAESIELTVNRKNIKAINFYFKMGFIIQKTADFDIGNGYFMNDFVMIKKIKHHVT